MTEQERYYKTALVQHAEEELKAKRWNRYFKVTIICFLIGIPGLIFIVGVFLIVWDLILQAITYLH